MNSFTEFRNPTPQELNQIPKWFEVYYSSLAEMAKKFAIIFLVISALFVPSFVSFDEVSVFPTVVVKGNIIPIIIIIACLIIGVCCLKVILNYDIVVNEFKRGNFVVVDGKISEIEPHADDLHCVNARISFANGSYSNKWYKIRKEYASFGSPIILVRLNSDKVNKKIEMAFTPFMLTEKGIQLQK